VQETTGTATLESFNPATGQLIGTVEATPPELVQSVVDDVQQVQPFWAQLSLSDRARYMRRAAQVVIDHLDELTALLSREQGRARAESYLVEFVPSIDALHWISDAGARVLADERVRQSQGFLLRKRTFLSYEPLGVVGVISPSTQPWLLPFLRAATALMCGNGVVLKPASVTPVIGQRVQAVFERAGLPEGIVRVVQGGAAVGTAVAEASTAKVFFTGSVDAGRRVAAACAERMKPATLDLSRKDAALVLADANLDNAIAGCTWGSFVGAGQMGAAIERIYVVREVAERFSRGMIESAARLRTGDPLSWDTDVGPLASPERFERVRELVEDAVTGGAVLRCGGPVESGGRFFAPAVLTGVKPEMRIMREEIRGPVAPIVVVRDEEEAIGLANDCALDFGASIWTGDAGKGTRIGRRMKGRAVWLNTHAYSARSRFDFYDHVYAKRVTTTPAATRDPWWFPYDEALGTALHTGAQLFYGRDADKRDALRRGAGPLARMARRVLPLD
jgi:acyl-CoA reductase-like NAD-dependent aldehyde dehydrogenase